MLMWIEHHGFEFFLMYYAFTAFTGGMPTPADDSGQGYRWLFSSLQILNGSLARLVATQFPASKMGQSLTTGPPVQPVVVADVNEPPKQGK